MRDDCIWLKKGLQHKGKEDLVRASGRKQHEYKLQKVRCFKNVKKFCFHNGSIDKWNGLGEEILLAN